MLAADDIVLQIDGEALRLRPSLRAAVRLDRRFAGLSSLLQGIGAGSITTLVALAVECGEPRFEAVILAPSIETWADRFERITPGLVRLIFDIAEIEPEAPAGPHVELPAPVETITLAEAYAQLFAAATGILGWPPATAWSATPGEVRAALDAHLSMFRAQHGIADPKPTGPDFSPLDSAGLASLADMQ